MRSPFTLAGGDVAAAGVGAAVAGNTGNGTITAAPATGDGCLPGQYRAVCTAAAANGGTFNVFAPNGVLLGTATVGTPFTTHLTFTIADGATDFAVGDAFTITVTRQLAVGSVIPAAGTAKCRIPVAGASKVRVCAKVSEAATLKCFRMRPDGETRSTIGNPADVALVADTEAKMDIDLYGEAYLEIEILADVDAATIAFVDVNQLGAE